MEEDRDVFVPFEMLSVMKESNIFPQYETIAAVKYTEMLVTRLNFIWSVKTKAEKNFLNNILAGIMFHVSFEIAE